MKRLAKNVLIGLIGCALGGGVSCYLLGKKNNTVQKKVDRLNNYYQILNQWLLLRHEDLSLDMYLSKNHYKTVAIYGMGELGKRLYEELKNTEITVAYCIDKKSDTVTADIPIIPIEEELGLVDAIIVTPTFDFQNISDKLKLKVDYPIISLEELIFNTTGEL